MLAAPPARLTRRAEFLRAARDGRKVGRSHVVVQALPRADSMTRLGFTATKKIGNAVIRNRTKRRLREAARLLLGQDAPPGFDLVMIGREATAERDFRTLLGDMRGALRQGGVLPPKEQPIGVLPPKEKA